MPIYELQCCSCGETFESYCANQENTEDCSCPRCGGRELKKLVSSFSARTGSRLAPAGKKCPRHS
ncbi:MAG: FmdB family zinc ribbon protein [Pseudomonadota bacterium]